MHQSQFAIRSLSMPALA